MILLPNVWCFHFGAQQMVVDWLKGFKVVLTIVMWKTCEDFCSIVFTRLLTFPWTSQVVDFH